jgi:hypothetical protein
MPYIDGIIGIRRAACRSGRKTKVTASNLGPLSESRPGPDLSDRKAECEDAAPMAPNPPKTETGARARRA